jgi:predicted small lipoprotein YifL
MTRTMLALALIALVAVPLAACGKKGALDPPPNSPPTAYPRVYPSE